MLPHKFKIIGFVIVIVSGLFVSTKFFFDVFFQKKILAIYMDSTIPTVEETSMKVTDEQGNIVKEASHVKTTHPPRDVSTPVLNLFLTIGIFIMMFSREKIEDERIDKIRLRVFQQAFKISILISIILAVINIFSGRIFDAGTLISIMGLIYFLNYTFLFQKEQAF